MIESKHEFYVEMQKNLAKMRVVMQTNDVLASLPSKICECVRSHDKDLEKYVELFETKMVEREREQKSYEEKTRELSEARTRLFAKLPEDEMVEETTSGEKEKMSKMVYKLITAINDVQIGIGSFREEHNRTDMDESIQHIEDVVTATLRLLTATSDTR